MSFVKKRRTRWIAIVLGIMMVISFMPAMAFADDEELGNNHYSADYYYDEDDPPAISVCPDGENVDFIPNIYKDVITVHKGDANVEFKYDMYINKYTQEPEYVLKNKDPNDNNYVDSVSYWYVSPTEVQIEIIGYSLNNGEKKYWGASANLKDVSVYNAVASIEFIPSSATTLYSEDIKRTYVDEEDGKTYTYYDIGKRSIHSQGGESWPSKFAVGDKLIVHYSDERTKTFINKDWYDDYEKEWCDDFFCGDERISVYMHEKEDLKAGNNEIVVEYHARETTFNLIMETPESRAAEAKAKAEAEAKAKAEAEAKAKAEAEAKAEAKTKASNINKGTVSASDIKKASNLGATEVTLGSKVKKIKANAFKGTNIKTVNVKTKKLKAKSVKGSLKGSKVKTIKVKVGKAKVNKKYVKVYKKIFTKKNAGKKVSVK